MNIESFLQRFFSSQKYNVLNRMQILIATLAFGSHFTVDRGGTVPHFHFLHHFCGPHYRIMYKCRYEKGSRMNVLR